MHEGAARLTLTLTLTLTLPLSLNPNPNSNQELLGTAETKVDTTDYP